MRMQISQGQKGPEARLIKLWINPIAAVAHTSDVRPAGAEIASAVRFMIKLRPPLAD